MQQKLKRIKTRSNAQKNSNSKKSYKKLDTKMRSCMAASATPNRQENRNQLILPNRLKKSQTRLNNCSSDNSLNNSIHFNGRGSDNAKREGSNYPHQQVHCSSSATNNNRNQHSRTTMTQKWSLKKYLQTGRARYSWCQLLVVGIFLLAIQSENIHFVQATSDLYASTTPMQADTGKITATTIPNAFSVKEPPTPNPYTTPIIPPLAENANGNKKTKGTDKYWNDRINRTQNNTNGDDSIFMRFARRFSTGNELWDGIIRDCYHQPSFICFQSNVYSYLNGALETNDVNVTQRLKFYKNHFNYIETNEEEDEEAEEEGADTLKEQLSTTEAAMEDDDERLSDNEIPQSFVRGRAASAPETPIEEITTALYGKSIKFAMTHDVEIQLPEMLFDGATFRISPRGFEGNGILAKLELIPKQEIEARLAGKILMNKIKKFLKSKLLLSFLAILLIIKIIKIKLFWILPIVVGVGAAKKLLLKFLLFLFPALSHLFKLCSYYQQTYHSTKYHHHLHHIDHHHTIVPPWHSESHHPAPEIIYTSPPKGHVSAYLNGAPIHETYGPPAFEHNEGNWENSGPGLGSDYIGDINRAAQIEENSNYFKPHTNDANEIQAWGLAPEQLAQIKQKPQYASSTQQQQQQRPPSLQQQHIQKLLQKNKQQQILAQTQKQYQNSQKTSQNFNPFASDAEKQSVYSSKYKMPLQAQSAPRPVYTPPRNAGHQIKDNTVHLGPHPAAGQNGGVFGLNAAQIAAQYGPTRNPSTQKQEPISPEVAAQLKEALRIQAEQRIIAQQQKILENEPFVQDGQPLMPKNYDPFYSPILLKIDKIVEQLGVTDELCKERLVCSMYKDPARYSPHSNFVSAELSRDTNELEPVTSTTNPAILRFYRLIQAARDGQDQRDCLRLYPQCSINTE